MDRRTYRSDANLHSILDVITMHWKCATPNCDSTSFKLIHYTPATMSVLCAKCGKLHNIIGPKFPLLIHSTPQVMELKVTDRDLMNEVSKLTKRIEELEADVS